MSEAAAAKVAGAAERMSKGKGKAKGAVERGKKGFKDLVRAGQRACTYPK